MNIPTRRMIVLDSPPRVYHRSVSQLKSFTRCSEQFRLERMVYPKLPIRPASWLILGSAAHLAFADWENSGRDIDALELFDRYYDEEVERCREIQPDMDMWLKPMRSKINQDLINRKKNGRNYVQNYITDAERAKWTVYKLPDGRPAVELEFDVMFGAVPIRGAIDLLVQWPGREFPVVRDLKTGNREKSTVQLGTYHVALKEMGIYSRYGEYFYMKDGKSSGFKDLSRYTLDYLTDIYTNLDRAIGEKLFIPNPGDACDLCPVFDYCREMGSRELPQKENE